jgi:hypothetical protein
MSWQISESRIVFYCCLAIERDRIINRCGLEKISKYITNTKIEQSKAKKDKTRETDANKSNLNERKMKQAN